MPSIRSSPRYDAVAKTLHWLIAAAIVAMLVIGWVMVRLPKTDPDKFALFQWHKSIGITILLLSLARFGWRLSHPAPPLPVAMPAWEKIAARATHALFYVLIIGMPLIGWAIVSASPLNLPTMLYGLVPWPNMPVLPDLENKREIGHALDSVHETGAYILAALLVLHVAAALKHHWFDRDDVLTRMAPNPVARLLMRLRGDRPGKNA
jgi:cytochrome b561